MQHERGYLSLDGNATHNTIFGPKMFIIHSLECLLIIGKTNWIYFCVGVTLRQIISLLDRHMWIWVCFSFISSISFVSSTFLQKPFASIIVSHLQCKFCIIYHPFPIEMAEEAMLIISLISLWIMRGFLCNTCNVGRHTWNLLCFFFFFSFL